jgi:hypothetical protein
MYFECGSWLLYLTMRNQTLTDKWTPRPTHWVKLFRRNFKKGDMVTLNNYVNDFYVYLHRLAYIYSIICTYVCTCPARCNSSWLQNFSALAKRAFISVYITQLNGFKYLHSLQWVIIPCFFPWFVLVHFSTIVLCRVLKLDQITPSLFFRSLL